MRKINYFVPFLVFSALTGTANAAEYLYKWKDKDGRTVYSDRIDLNHKGKFDVYSSRNVMLKKEVDRELTESEYEQKMKDEAEQKKLAQDKEIQAKRDKAIVNAYTNVAELDKMKEFELSQIKQLITNTNYNISRMNDRKKEIDSSLSKSKEGDNNAQLIKENDKLKLDIEQAQKLIKQNQELYTQRESKFNEDRERLERISAQSDKN